MDFFTNPDKTKVRATRLQSRPMRSIRHFAERFGELFRQAIDNLFDRKLRTFLTLSGIVIGIAALAALQAFAEGARVNVLERWQKLGSMSQFAVMSRDRSMLPKRLRASTGTGEKAPGDSGSAMGAEESAAGGGDAPAKQIGRAHV